MGMFDEVRVLQELPAPPGLPSVRVAQFHAEQATLEFQTKDLDCVLDRYVVTEGGELLRQEGSRGTGEQSGEERLEFHGRFEIHTLFFVDDVGLVERNGLTVRVLGPTFSGEAYAISYVLKFTDGRLAAVEHPCASRL